MIDKIKFKIGKKKAMLEYICGHLKREYYFSVIEDLFLYCFNLLTYTYVQPTLLNIHIKRRCILSLIPFDFIRILFHFLMKSHQGLNS